MQVIISLYASAAVERNVAVNSYSLCSLCSLLHWVAATIEVQQMPLVSSHLVHNAD